MKGFASIFERSAVLGAYNAYKKTASGSTNRLTSHPLHHAAGLHTLARDPAQSDPPSGERGMVRQYTEQWRLGYQRSAAQPSWAGGQSHALGNARGRREHPHDLRLADQTVHRSRGDVRVRSQRHRPRDDRGQCVPRRRGRAEPEGRPAEPHLPGHPRRVPPPREEPAGVPGADRHLRRGEQELAEVPQRAGDPPARALAAGRATRVGRTRYSSPWDSPDHNGRPRAAPPRSHGVRSLVQRSSHTRGESREREERSEVAHRDPRRVADPVLTSDTTRNAIRNG